MGLFEALGLLGGALTRLFPSVLNYFKEGRDLKYELLRIDKQVDLERLRGANAQAEIAASANANIDIEYARALVTAQAHPPEELHDTGSWFLNFMNAVNVSVRPVLTYWWCLVMYSVYKAMLIYVALGSSLPLAEIAAVIATEFDRGVIGSIIGFWFVDRALRAKAAT